MLVAFGGQVGPILAERAGSPAPHGADPLAVRERNLLRQVTQYRKDHGLTAGMQGGPACEAGGGVGGESGGVESDPEHAFPITAVDQPRVVALETRPYVEIGTAGMKQRMRMRFLGSSLLPMEDMIADLGRTPSSEAQRKSLTDDTYEADEQLMRQEKIPFMREYHKISINRARSPPPAHLSPPNALTGTPRVMIDSAPKGEVFSLKPHQLTGAGEILYHETEETNGGILADDMGLGKRPDTEKSQ